MLAQHKMKRVATKTRKKTVSMALAAIFALSPLQPLLAQDAGSQAVPAQALENQQERTGAATSKTADGNILLQEPSKSSDSSKSIPGGEERVDSPQTSNAQTPQNPSSQTPAAPGDADPSFVSEIQASQKSTQLKADESSGALRYDYPLQLPPGRNGLQPDLKLSYNSQNQEEGSVFGYGWTINIPYIQRKNTHGTDKLYSGSDFTSALSGELTATNSGNSTFISRADDGGYLKYSLDSNQTWTVQSKQGLTYIFGATAGERQDNPTNPAHVYTWLLSSIADSNGNTLTYTYTKDKGQIYPDRISYGDIFEVSFARAARLDQYHGYRTGFSVTSAYLISSIQVKINNSVSKSYLLAYSNNPTSSRSRLQSVSVQDATRTYPPTTFDYQLESDKGFNPTYSSNSIPVDLKSGALPVDINGDGYADLIKAYEWNYVDYRSDKSISINHPESNNWQLTSAWQLPLKIMIDTDGAWNRNVDSGTRVVDFNGDMKPDFLRYQNVCTICTTDQEVNTGSGWSETANWLSPINTNGGTRTVLDLNGDGLTDVFGTNSLSDYGMGRRFQTTISLNNGSDFNTYGHHNSMPPDPSMPFTDAPDFLSDYLEVDINADGLPDLIKSSWYYGYPTSFWDKRIYLNTGSGWTTDPAWTFPDVCYFCQGSAGQNYNTIYFQDFNNDGYVDFVIPGGAYVNNQQVSYSNVYINNAHGWTEDPGWYSQAYFYSQNCFCQNPALFFDGNADGSPDIYVSNQSGNGIPSTNIFENKNHHQVDLLSTVTLPSGGTISVTYKTSAQYRDASGNLLNPRLPLIIQTVEKIITDDKNGGVSTATYSYADGSYYYNGPFDRKFAGFGSITTTDAAGNVSKTYLHQGNESNQILGENGDEYWKIGKPYRLEKYDNAGHLYSRTINRWDSFSLGGNARFVKLAQSLESIYDGNSTHKDKAETYTYDDATGNLTQKISLGQVNGNDDGTFTDTGTDTYTTNISYASGSSLNVIGLPSQETVLDANSNKVKETKYYYDALPSGQVGKGNLTRQEDWKEDSSYVHTTKTYNSYGLVTQETDPLDKQTTYAYDQFNLYPEIVTNALHQTTQFQYDYASGKVKQKTDSNNHVFKTVYDGLGRVLEEKEPDPNAANGSPLVTKSSYVYTDIGAGSSVRKTHYLDGTIGTDSYNYLDGLGRLIQTRKQAESASNFSVKDFVYNNLGLLGQESLPYFSGGSAKTIASASGALYTSYTYDALQRVATIRTALGQTINTYDDWKLNVTDANGKVKDLYSDAYERLVQVDEHNGPDIYTTRYEYNGLGKLLKITDASGNVRSFSYDGLGQRRRAEDLHVPDDTTFGVWTYNYDESGNLISRLDPNGQTILYTYDDLNRVLSEDYTRQDGVEVAYVYDNCAGGVGRLCSITSSALTGSKTYNSLGLIKTEDKTIDAVNYHTEYSYDRQGNQARVINPDGSQVIYQYNNAGLLEQVQLGQNGARSLTPLIQNLDYSPLDQITFMQYSNGARTTNTYDPARLYRLQRKVTLLPNVSAAASSEDGRVRTSRANTLATERVAQDLTYSYDNVGNILSIVDASDTNTKKTITYTYDDLYRLTSATTAGAPGELNYVQTYSYDVLGNIRTKSDQGTYSYDGDASGSYANPHAVTKIATAFYQTTFQYDRNGNLTATSNEARNKWDYNNRLVQSNIGSAVVTYAYDENGQRVKYSNGPNKIIYPSRYYNISRTKNAPKGESPTDNATKHIFIGDEPVATFKGTLNPIIYAVHTDHLTGSNVVSNASGQIEELTDYYPFGAIRLEENQGAFVEQRKFAGHEYDADTELTYMDARYYNGMMARFLSADPAYLSVGNDDELKSKTRMGFEEYLSDPQNLNCYSYVRNSPLRYIDLHGNSLWSTLKQMLWPSGNSNQHSSNSNANKQSTVAAPKNTAKSTGTQITVSPVCIVPTPDHPIIRAQTDDDRIYRLWRELLVDNGYMNDVLMNPLWVENTQDPGQVVAFNKLHEQAKREVLGDKYKAPDASQKWAEGILGGIDFINGVDFTGKDQNRNLGKPNQTTSTKIKH